MIVNDSNKSWKIVKPNGITIVVNSGDAYDPNTEQVLTIKKPE